MKHASLSGIAACTSMSIAMIANPVLAGETVVLVDPTVPLTSADLLAGQYESQSFTLTPETTFDLPAYAYLLNLSPDDPIDLLGSTLRFRAQSELAGNWSFHRTEVVLESGSFASGTLDISGGSSLTVSGDTLYSTSVRGSSSFSLRGGYASALDLSEGSNLDIFAGSTGQHNMITSGATANIYGGSLGESSIIDSTVNILGGFLGSQSIASGSTRIQLAGGGIHFGLHLTDNAMLSISGGSLGDGFVALEGTTVELMVEAASINGIPLDAALGETFVITERGGALFEATFADGSLFSRRLDGEGDLLSGYIDQDATLTVMLVPASGAASLFGLTPLLMCRRRRA